MQLALLWSLLISGLVLVTSIPDVSPPQAHSGLDMATEITEMQRAAGAGVDGTSGSRCPHSAAPPVFSTALDTLQAELDFP